MNIIVNDANILIDLVKLDLVTQFFGLPFEFQTTSLILEELFADQLNLYQPFIENQTFTVAEFSAEEFESILNLMAECAPLSPQDCSAFFQARKTGGALITGDNSLRKFSHKQKIPVYGHLWVLDNLVANGLISGEEATGILDRLTTAVNPRLGLPKEECQTRILLWKSL